MRLRRSVLSMLVPAFVAVGGTVPAAASAAPAFLAPSSLSLDGYNADQPQVAVGPNGDAVAAWRRNSGSGYVVQAATRPAGGAWSVAQTVSAANAGQPQVAVDAAGDAIVVFDQGGVRYADAPAGHPFGASQLLSSETQATPQVAMDAAGDTFVAFVAGVSPNVTITTATRPAGGAFGAAQPVSTAGRDPYRARIAADRRGDVIVAWTATDATTGYLEDAYRPAGGGWGMAQTLDTGGKNISTPDVAIADDGSAVATWLQDLGTGYAVRAATDVPGAATAPVVTVGPSAELPTDPTVGVGPNGAATVAWTDHATTKQVVRESTRTATGQPFSAGATISPLAEGADYPVVAMGPSGRTTIVWQSAVDASTIIVRASSRDVPTGLFPASTRLTAAGEFGYEPQVDADADGDAMTVWRGDVPGITSYVTRAAGLDAAGPQLRALSVPASGVTGSALSFSTAPLDVFSGVASTTWDFGDGATASGAAVSHAYAAAGTYTAKVTATDGLGNVSATQRTVTITTLSGGGGGGGGVKLNGGTDIKADPYLGEGPAIDVASKVRRGTPFDVVSHATMFQPTTKVVGTGKAYVSSQYPVTSWTWEFIQGSQDVVKKTTTPAVVGAFSQAGPATIKLTIRSLNRVFETSSVVTVLPSVSGAISMPSGAASYFSKFTPSATYPTPPSITKDQSDAAGVVTYSWTVFQNGAKPDLLGPGCPVGTTTHTCRTFGPTHKREFPDPTALTAPFDPHKLANQTEIIVLDVLTADGAQATGVSALKLIKGKADNLPVASFDWAPSPAVQHQLTDFDAVGSHNVPNPCPLVGEKPDGKQTEGGGVDLNVQGFQNGVPSVDLAKFGNLSFDFAAGGCPYNGISTYDWTVSDSPLSAPGTRSYHFVGTPGKGISGPANSFRIGKSAFASIGTPVEPQYGEFASVTGAETAVPAWAFCCSARDLVYNFEHAGKHAVTLDVTGHTGATQAAVQSALKLYVPVKAAPVHDLSIRGVIVHSDIGFTEQPCGPYLIGGGEDCYVGRPGAPFSFNGVVVEPQQESALLAPGVGMISVDCNDPATSAACKTATQKNPPHVRISGTKFSTVKPNLYAVVPKHDPKASFELPGVLPTGENVPNSTGFKLHSLGVLVLHPDHTASTSATVEMPAPITQDPKNPVTATLDLKSTADGTRGSRAVPASGVSASGFHIDTQDFTFGGLDLPFHVVADGTGDGHVDGTISTDLAGAAQITGAIHFVDGAFKGARLTAGPGLNIPLPPIFTLDRVGLNIGVNPTILGGEAAVNIGPTLNLPVLGPASAARIDGNLTISFPSGGTVFHADASLHAAGLDLGRVMFDASSAGFHADASVYDSLFGVATIKGGLGVDFYGVKAFDITGDVDISLLGIDLLGGDVIISSKGAKACVHWIGPDFGAWATWSPTALGVIGSGCDIGNFKASARAVPRAGGLAGVDLAGGSGAAIKITGSGGVPAYTLLGPGGVRFHHAPSAAPAHPEGNFFAVDDVKTNTSYVMLNRPAAGTWSVQPDAGSAAVASVTSADALPKPRVRASVVGRGASRVLRYHLDAQPGDTVTFAEQGDHGRAAQVIHPAGSKETAELSAPDGRIPFTPAAGRAGRRRIIATVSHNGVPRTQLVVARYSAPLLRPAAIKGLRIVRRGSTVVATWRPDRLADHTRVTLRTRYGNETVLTLRGTIHRQAFRDVSPYDTARVTVTGVRGGAAGPTVRVTAHGRRVRIPQLCIAKRGRRACLALERRAQRPRRR